MVELKINALNQLKLLKQSTFKDPLCFLDEDIQNAQRAKANNVTIKTNYFERTLKIFNDGEVLDDPQKLFSIAESGWDDDTVKSENPFGIGFFSNIVVSNNITIKTGNKKIIFDVDKMLLDGDTKVDTEIIEDEDEFINGFELTLHNFDYDKYSESSIKERAQDLANYINELHITVNEVELKSIPKTQPDAKYKFTKIIQNDMCEGWLAIGSNWSWENSLAIYYKGRIVTKLEDMHYIAGKLHINNNILNLVAPDRKDIIHDEKYENFIHMIQTEMTKLCNETALKNNVNLDNYTYCIKRYFKPEEIQNTIKFITFKTKNENDMNYLAAMSIQCAENDQIQSLEDYEISLKEAHQKIENDINIDIPPAEINEYNELDETNENKLSANITSNNDTNDDLTEMGYNEKSTTNINCDYINKTHEPIFYMKFADVKSLTHKINIARTYDLRIIIARNDIEYEILEQMQTTESGEPVVHISSLSEDITISGSITNTQLTAKEKRASMLFGMLSQMFNHEENIFVIGDINVIKTVSIMSINKTQKIKDDSIKILYSEDYDVIFIDRSIINDTKLTPNLSSKMNIRDMQFIIANLENIAKAITSFIYGSESLYNVEKTEHQILKLLSRYEPTKEIPTLDDSESRKLSRREKKKRNKERLHN